MFKPLSRCTWSYAYVGIIVNTVKRAHPGINLNVNFNLTFNPLIKGEFYAHFNDFIRIFMENMFKHSIGNRIDCSIDIKEDGDNIVMIFVNNNVNRETQIPTENEGVVNNKSVLKLITEGKSGFVKARKIIRDDLRNENNNLMFNTDNDTFKVTTVINYSPLIA